MTTRRITELTAKLDALNPAAHHKRHVIRAKLRKAWFEVFDNDKALAKALADLENASTYDIDDNGIYLWFCYSGLGGIDNDTRDYLEQYVNALRCTYVDWDNECFKTYEGDSLIIQDDSPHRRDNGVWLDRKQVINESEYRDDDDNVDETKRNALIEAYMEKSGFFPGVFRLTRNGDVFPVSTQAKVG